MVTIVLYSNTMSSKNKLQELYQKDRKDLPIYTTVNLSGIPNEPEWKAEVKTCDGYRIWSQSFPRKTHAENDAAERCLALINKKNSQISLRVQNYIEPDKTVTKNILLFDLENVPLSARTRVSTPNNDTAIFGFVGKYNQGILKDRESIESMMKLIIVNTTGANAADHAITFYAGLLASEYMRLENGLGFNIRWFILSSDQFAAVPIELLQKFGFKDSYSVTNLNELKKQLPELVFN